MSETYIQFDSFSVLSVLCLASSLRSLFTQNTDRRPSVSFWACTWHTTDLQNAARARETLSTNYAA